MSRQKPDFRKRRPRPARLCRPPRWEAGRRDFPSPRAADDRERSPAGLGRRRRCRARPGDTLGTAAARRSRPAHPRAIGRRDQLPGQRWEYTARSEEWMGGHKDRREKFPEDEGVHPRGQDVALRQLDESLKRRRRPTGPVRSRVIYENDRPTLRQGRYRGAGRAKSREVRFVGFTGTSTGHPPQCGHDSRSTPSRCRQLLDPSYRASSSVLRGGREGSVSHKASVATPSGLTGDHRQRACGTDEPAGAVTILIESVEISPKLAIARGFRPMRRRYDASQRCAAAAGDVIWTLQSTKRYTGTRPRAARLPSHEQLPL